MPPPLLVAEPVAAPSESGSPPQRPSNTAAPTIFGTAQQGQLLTASQGAWSGSPSSYSYQWLRCDFTGASCAPLALATTSSYSVVEADVGHTLRVVVIASNAAGSSAPATSPATEPVVAALQPPVNKTPPAISGMAQQGQLHGKAQAIGGAAAAHHEVLIGSGKDVMPRQGVRITRQPKPRRLAAPRRPTTRS